MRSKRDGHRGLAATREPAHLSFIVSVATARGNAEGALFGESLVFTDALALYGTEQNQAAKDLISLLHSQEVFEKALIEIIEEHFDLDDYKLPD